MIHNLVVFYRTQNEEAQGIRLWPSSAKLWPTYVTLGVAALSAILATAVLLAYISGTKTANKWNMARTILGIITVIFTAIIWVISAVGLQSTSDFKGIGSQSLWSASCDATDQQHEIFGHTIDFHQFCLEQVRS
jgi:hypothetical protein